MRFLGLSSPDKELKLRGGRTSTRAVFVRSHQPMSPVCLATQWVSEALGGLAAGGVGLGQRLTIIVEAWETKSFREAKVGRGNQDKAVHSNVSWPQHEAPRIPWD